MSSYIEFPNVRCSSCAGVVGSKFDIFKELISIGYSEPQAFEALNIQRYCCRLELTSPPVMSPMSNREPSSIASTNKNTLNLDLILSSILNDNMVYPSLKYVAERLKENSITKPRTESVEYREKMKEKDKASSSSGKILFDMNGNVKGKIPKEIPEIEDDEESKFNKRKQLDTRYNYTVVGVVDVGTGMKVERISRTIKISDEPDMPSNIRKEVSQFLDIDNADTDSIIKWLNKGKYKMENMNTIITLLEDENVYLEDKYYKYNPHEQIVYYYLRFHSTKFGEKGIKIIQITTANKKPPTNIGKGKIKDQADDLDDMLASLARERARYDF